MKRLIDVSHHQKGLNLESIPSVDGVIIRLGYADVTDKEAVGFINQCIDLQIPFGLYWYSYAVLEMEARNELKTIIDVVNSINVSKYVKFPFFIDMEDADGQKKNKLGRKWSYADSADILSYMLPYLDDNLQMDIGWYMSQNDAIDVLKDSPHLDIYIKWIARWNEFAPSIQCDFWQYTNNYHGVDASYINDCLYDLLVTKNIKQKKLSDYKVAELLDEIMKR